MTHRTVGSHADTALVSRLQRAAFEYILRYSNPGNGLIADTSRPGSPCSIAVVGFGLASYLIAVERGWLRRSEAARRVLTTLRTFRDGPQGPEPDVMGYKGFYYHFLDMQTGRRVWNCEVSLIDTTLLLAGILTAAQYFDARRERELRDTAAMLYERIDWPWAQHDAPTLSQGWHPQFGFLHYGWEGYNEALILYILGLGSPTLPLPKSSFANWTLTYQWERLLGQDVLYSGPLFTHLFSQAWIDFRALHDAFMREKSSDYFQNTCRAIALQREYCERNPRQAAGYGRDIWGISAGDGPTIRGKREFFSDNRHFGYMARGVPYGPDDGTLCPWAMLACLPFAADAALAGTRNLLEKFPQVCPEDRFASGFNPSLNTESGGWLSEGWYGLDQGLLVMSIENARSGLIWDLMRDSPAVRRGLRHCGFRGGWLGR
ncbi:MAG TPA: glucoamylase family protein [Steroidobacteraceae bacterium]|jgi:hypothetical protein|nr:glucoamylase family protein [Steroidobacteraceae bacterium]